MSEGYTADYVRRRGADAIAEEMMRIGNERIKASNENLAMRKLLGLAFTDPIPAALPPSDRDAVREAAIEECARIAEATEPSVKDRHEAWMHGFHCGKLAAADKIRSTFAASRALKTKGGGIQSEGRDG
jgi:hypothetical protein